MKCSNLSLVNEFLVRVPNLNSFPSSCRYGGSPMGSHVSTMFLDVGEKEKYGYHSAEYGHHGAALNPAYHHNYPQNGNAYNHPHYSPLPHRQAAYQQHQLHQLHPLHQLHQQQQQQEQEQPAHPRYINYYNREHQQRQTLMATKRYDTIQQQQLQHAAAAGLLHGLPRHPSLAATEAVAAGSPKFRARSGSKHGFNPGYLPPINTPFVPGSTDLQPTPGGGPFIPYPIGKGEAPWKQIFEKVRKGV